VTKARQEGYDVVLIDTAGRMQHNDLLMRALAKVRRSVGEEGSTGRSDVSGGGQLVNTNNPDLVLFVGEALVGNDGVDQLVSFSEALTRFGTGSAPRTVDGVFLTKFDTVDEKMGAAVSMVYATGAPIVFVGVGQHYTSVRKYVSCVCVCGGGWC
jgi:signal recognition particle receptor subunit alpha